VPYFELWEDNVLRLPGINTWPASLLRQVKGYVVPRSWFTDSDAEALSKHLGGRISKFQSLNSEDAVAWSWFGTLTIVEPEIRRSVVQWLYDRLGLELEASTSVGIDQWSRVVHPNAPDSPHGPELDARIDDPGQALVYVEAKWDAGLGTGKGSGEGGRDDQIVLRRDSFRTDPARKEDRRRFVVLVVSNAEPDLSRYLEASQPQQLRRVSVAWLTWSELASCDAHPLAADFRGYLAWKRQLAGARASIQPL
jgi:hypothetical protein